MAGKHIEILTNLVKDNWKECENEPSPESILDLNEYCLHHIFSYIVNIRERIRMKRGLNFYLFNHDYSNLCIHTKPGPLHVTC